MTTWVRISNRSKEIYKKKNPPAGTFAINGNDEVNRCEFAESKMIFDENGGESARKLAPGVCHVPDWYEHGSLFVYNWAEDAWDELDYSEKEVTCTWRRV